MEKLSELTGLPQEVFWILIGLFVVSLVLVLVKKIIGFVLLGALILVGVYLVFGISPSESLEEVEKAKDYVVAELEEKEVMASLDKLAKTVDEKGRAVLEGGDFKITYNEDGERIIQNIKEMTETTYNEFIKDLTPEEVKELESKLN